MTRERIGRIGLALLIAWLLIIWLLFWSVTTYWPLVAALTALAAVAMALIFSSLTGWDR